MPAWIRCRPYALPSLVFFAVLGLPFLLRAHSEWDDVYIRASRELLAGRPIYTPGAGYVYPPFMAFAAIPLTFLSQQFERLAWFIVNVVSLVFIVRWTWELSGGRQIQAQGTQKSEHMAFLLGLGCALRYAVDCFAHQQTDILIAALVIGGCVNLGRMRPFLASTAFGLAAGMKCTALLWCFYLAWVGRWRAAIWVGVVAVGINLLPNLLGPSPGSGMWLADWVKESLAPKGGPASYPGDWYSDMIYNQSIAGGVNRWLLTTWTWNKAGLAVIDRSGPLSPQTVKLVLFLLEMAIVVIGITAASGRYGKSSAGQPSGSSNSLLYSMVLILMVLLSPMSSKPHFCTLLLPGFCLARIAMRRKESWPLVCLAMAAVSGCLGISGLVGGRLASLSLWYGNVTWSALFLYAGCCWAIRQQAEPPARADFAGTTLRRAA
jgi:hypothetical protein